MTRKVSDLLRRKNFKAALSIAEKEIYLAAYEHSGYNQVKAAKLLGVNRGTFIGRLKEWGIIKKPYSEGLIWLTSKGEMFSREKSDANL